ncbi:putative sugar O-methyltransferase [bacterium]|nr:putative sugar O-methyltransferase [bacterium]
MTIIRKLILIATQLLVYPILLNLGLILNFFNLRKYFAIKYNDFIERSKQEGLNFLPVGTYEWDVWRRKIKDAFSKKLPVYFLHNSLVGKTMVHGSVAHQEEKLSKIRSIYSSKIAKTLLKESVIGFPIITSLKYKSSANTIHQAFHLSCYYEKTNKNLVESKNIVEWGGGYGCLARILCQINPSCTYTILDLPELSALQYVYLASIFGKQKVNFITNSINIKKGKINLLSSDRYIKSDFKLETETFITNWALTESGESYQNFVVSQNFFSAKNILVSCIEDQNNFIINRKHPFYEHKVSIEVLGERNFYLMK